MPTIYEHEIASYRIAVNTIEAIYSKELNRTHVALAMSNQFNLLLIGLCGLVEAHLFQLIEKLDSSVKMDDFKGQGFSGIEGSVAKNVNL